MTAESLRRNLHIFIRSLALTLIMVLFSAFWSILHGFAAILPKIIKHGFNLSILSDPLFLSIALVSGWFYINLPHNKGPFELIANLKTLATLALFFVGLEYQPIATLVSSVVLLVASNFYAVRKIENNAPRLNGTSTTIYSRPHNSDRGLFPLSVVLARYYNPIRRPHNQQVLDEAQEGTITSL